MIRSLLAHGGAKALVALTALLGVGSAAAGALPGTTSHGPSASANAGVTATAGPQTLPHVGAATGATVKVPGVGATAGASAGTSGASANVHVGGSTGLTLPKLPTTSATASGSASASAGVALPSAGGIASSVRQCLSALRGALGGLPIFGQASSSATPSSTTGCPVDVASCLSGIVGSATSLASMSPMAIFRLFTGILQCVSSVIRSVLDTVGNVPVIGGTLGSIPQAVSTCIQSAFGAAGGILSGGVSGVPGAIGGIGQCITSVLQSAFSTIGNLPVAGATVGASASAHTRR